MAVYYPKPLARLVAEFEKLPGIGPKSAQRLAFHVMRLPAEETRALAEALLGLRDNVQRQCRFSARFGAKDFDDPSLGNALTT